MNNHREMFFDATAATWARNAAATLAAGTGKRTASGEVRQKNTKPR
jgi:hypothetical protein